MASFMASWHDDAAMSRSDFCSAEWLDHVSRVRADDDEVRRLDIIFNFEQLGVGSKSKPREPRGPTTTNLSDTFLIFSHNICIIAPTIACYFHFTFLLPP